MALFRFISNRFHPRKEKKRLPQIERKLSESQEIDEQNFLPEILHKIFQNLNIQDLSRSAAVNKLWNEVAIQQQKQRGPDGTVICLQNVNFYDFIRTKPYVALMFVAPNEHDIVEKLFPQVLKKYKNYFPNYLVVHEVLLESLVMMDEQLITCNHELTEGCILTLLIPEYRDLKIRAAYRQHLNDKDFLNEFLPEDSHSNVTFIIFTKNTNNCSPGITRLLFDLLKKSMADRQQKYSLWGAGSILSPYVAINSHIDKRVEEALAMPELYYHYNGIFAMSITGSSLESWSVVINCLTKKHEFDEKLTDFRNQLRFKRRSIGLACGPQDVLANEKEVYETFFEILRAVKQIFPDVSFIGTSENCKCNEYYGLNSKIDDPEQQLRHDHNHFSLMILTFD